MNKENAKAFEEFFPKMFDGKCDDDESQCCEKNCSCKKQRHKTPEEIKKLVEFIENLIEVNNDIQNFICENILKKQNKINWVAARFCANGVAASLKNFSNFINNNMWDLTEWEEVKNEEPKNEK